MSTATREKLVMAAIYLAFGLIISRLFYWQIIKGAQLQAVAEDQYHRTITKQGSRGSIFTTDGHVLVTNTTVYRLFAEPQILQQSPEEIAKQLTPILLTQEQNQLEPREATDSAIIEDLSQDITNSLKANLAKETQWVSLYTNVTPETKAAIEQLAIYGLGFDPYEKRHYPEASMAAHVTGFVGKNEAGEDVGYFGLEGALEKELQARSAQETIFTDAFGLQLIGNEAEQRPLDGRDVTITIRRDIQHLIETKLEAGIEQYGAKAGEVIVMDPQTGKILGLAASPDYDQAEFHQYSSERYKNPSLSNLYEPGSTFKILTVAAGIDAGAITPETVCTNCDGPRQFGQYTIRTWNDVYNPNITISEGLAKSDNVAMIFAAEQIGSTTFREYLQKFGIGQALNLSLQGDQNTPFPQKWGKVELATTAFGQGVSTNSLQLLRAVSAIANNGVMMRPMIVEKVTNPGTGQEITTPVQKDQQVVSADTAHQVTEMMINAAQTGEAQWTASETHTVAGKTGTSQIAVEGEYAEDRTITSYIGFANPDNPKFIMLVKLVEPQSSPWAAETAAPLWYDIADKLYLLLNIPPDR